MCLALPLAFGQQQLYTCWVHNTFTWLSLTKSKRKLENALSFQDIFTKIVGQLPLNLAQGLVKTKLKLFVIVSISWFICSMKNEKM